MTKPLTFLLIENECGEESNEGGLSEHLTNKVSSVAAYLILSFAYKLFIHFTPHSTPFLLPPSP